MRLYSNAEHNMFAVAALTLDFISKMKPNRDKNELMYEFASSNIYSELFREECKYWTEGPAYIAWEYFREIGDEESLSKYD